MLIARDENITDRGSLLDCNFRLWTIFEARSQCLTRLSHYTRVDLNSSCSFVLQPQIEGVRGAFGNDSSSQPADGFLAKAMTRCPTESKPLRDKILSFATITSYEGALALKVSFTQDLSSQSRYEYLSLGSGLTFGRVPRTGLSSWGKSDWLPTPKPVPMVPMATLVQTI